LDSLLQYIKTHVLYLQDLGIDFFPQEQTGRGSGKAGSELLEELFNSMRDCRRCSLFNGRKNMVFGQGNPDTDLMFIGEGPGEEEDLQGLPFVGRSGQLLDKIITAMNLDRTKIYIANIVKCRPPGNRNPSEEEIEKCLPFLEKQISIIRPKVICVLGAVAFNVLAGKKLPITKNRGKWYEYKGIKMMPTFHPSYLLRNYTRETRAAVWDDMKEIMKYLKINNESIENE